MSVKYTGYWMFICNPKKWEIDRFLMSGRSYDSFIITEWQKDHFKPGQLGIVRVGIDRRNKTQLGGRERLKPGIYAIVEILDEPKYTTDADDLFWIDKEEAKQPRYRVKIKYLKSMLNKPLLIQQIKHDKLLGKDRVIIKSFQGSSFPISEISFKRIMELTSSPELLENIDKFDADSLEEIVHIEKKFKYAVPEVKEVISKRIERGKIAEKLKEINNYKCQICEAMGKNPKVFKKPDGKYYIEVHHIIPVSSLIRGTLNFTNLITVCPNHHRQLHYGNVQILKNTEKEVVFKIDGKVVEIKKGVIC